MLGVTSLVGMMAKHLASILDMVDDLEYRSLRHFLQWVVGTLLNDAGCPVCCEIWPGNTADVKHCFRWQIGSKSVFPWTCSAWWRITA
jgi:hypothetical protein